MMQFLYPTDQANGRLYIAKYMLIVNSLTSTIYELFSIK